MKPFGNPPCNCCDGLRLVESGEGEMRPCSRCRGSEFRQWQERRRVVIAAEKAAAAAERERAASAPRRAGADA